MFSCRNGHLHVAQYIMQQDASITESKNGRGDTLLHCACRYVPPPSVVCLPVSTEQGTYPSILPWP